MDDQTTYFRERPVIPLKSLVQGHENPANVKFVRLRGKPPSQDTVEVKSLDTTRNPDGTFKINYVLGSDDKTYRPDEIAMYLGK